LKYLNHLDKYSCIPIWKYIFIKKWNKLKKLINYYVDFGATLIISDSDLEIIEECKH